MPYPIENRADSLEIDFYAIQRQVGRFLGIGYSQEEWDDEQATEVQDIIDEGMRQAYYPPPLTQPYSYDAGSVHSWSFMQPTFEFSTVSGERRYLLPEGFEQPVGNVAYTDTNNAYSPIQFAPASRLRSLEASTDYQAPPAYGAIEPGNDDGSAPQGLILVLHPTPDAAYSMAMQYQAHGRRLTAEAPYPLGGQAFGPVVVASCLAAAELRVLRQAGPQAANFLQHLAGAIARDRQRGPALLGYNGDHSLNICGRGTVRRLGGLYSAVDATYNGVAYTG
jgi:hypothetical protein